MENRKNKQSLWTKVFIMTFIINTFSGIGMYMTNPIMADCLLEKGIPFELTGFLSSVLSWVSLTFRPISGWASDNYNKKKIMLASYGITTLCMFLYMVFPSPALIVCVRIMHGIAFGFTATLSLTFATTFIDKSILAEGLAYLSLGQLLGSMFGPQIGSSIADAYSISTTFVAAGVLSLVAFILIFFLPYQYEEKEKKGFKLDVKELIYPDVLPMMILICIFSIGNGVISYYIRNFGVVRSIANVTLFFTVNSIVMAISKPLSSKLHDTKGIAYVLYPAFIISAISMLFLSYAYSLIPVLIAAALKAVGQGVGSPALQAESAKIAGEDKSGVAISTCLVGQDLGNAIGPVIGSMLIASQGYTFTFNFLAILTVCGLIYFGFYYNKVYKHKFLKKKEEE